MPRREMTLGERALRDGLLATHLGGEEAAAEYRRRSRQTEKERLAEYTRQALALERADEAFPSPPPSNPAVNMPPGAAAAVLAEVRVMMAEMERRLRAEILASVAKLVKAHRNGN